MDYGFIYLHRKISENWIWQRSDYFHWFCHLLLKANFKDNKVLFEGEFIDLKRGQFITSYRKLASELPNCSEQKIRTFLNLLKKDKIVLIENLKKATQITICKYVDYQNAQHSSNTVATQQQHSSNTVATTENKEKKVNKGNKDKIYIDFLFNFNELTKRKFRVLDEKTKRQLSARLKEGFMIEEIYTAIKNCKADKYHIENPQYLTPEFITRPDKLQKYLNSIPTTGVNGNGKAKITLSEQEIKAGVTVNSTYYITNTEKIRIENIKKQAINGIRYKNNGIKINYV